MKTFQSFTAVIRQRVEEAAAGVTHCTWDPEGPGVIRLHLVPPKPGLLRGPSLLFINGTYIIPVSHSWAALLRVFMNELNESYQPGNEVDSEGMEVVLDKVASHMQRLYPRVHRDKFKNTIWKFQDIIRRIAVGEHVPELDGVVMSIKQYAPYMNAPHRMDLAVKSMRVDGKWQCPLECGICYASVGPAMQVEKGGELTTEQWFSVMDKLWKVGVPQISFTGGEPLERRDIAELVAYGEQFITRLNTSAVLLTPEMARKLRRASLDVMQVTVYSHHEDVHDKLVGRKGAWGRTMRGIGNAIEAGLLVSINTPLLPENSSNYRETVAFLAEMGIRYFSCSSVLPAGGAKDKIESGEVLSKKRLYSDLCRAKKFATRANLELDFTSPGWLTEDQIKKLGMTLSVCGACFGNMAIAPDGVVLPCQSWVHNKNGLGNILTMPWKKIWNHPTSKKIRKQAALKNDCPLAEVMQ